MALENGSDIVMPVSPMGFGGFGNNFGGWGGDGGWWVILFLFAMMGNGFGGFGGFGGGWGMMDGILPYFYNTQTQNDVNRGFDSLGISNQITGLQSSIDEVRTGNQLSGIQDSINSGFASAEVANCNRAMDAMQTAYNNQIANMNQQFATATELDNRLDNLAMSLQKCCCNNELATVRTQGIVQTEAAANRYADATNTRDIIDSQTRGTQAILDKLCQLELDGVKAQVDAKNERIGELQTQLNMANLAASQNAQTAALVSDNNAQTRDLIQRIAPYPIPSFTVGNPYGYGYNTGYGNCGCGCGGVA